MDKLEPRHRAALTILAGCPDGATEHALLAFNNVNPATLYDLVRDNLVRVERQFVTTRGCGQGIHVNRFRITAAGRAELKA